MPAFRQILRSCLPGVLGLGMTGCAAYHPVALPDAMQALPAPAIAVLTVQANAIDRPWLRPVAIDPAQPLDGDAIAAITVLANPDLRAQRAQSGVTEAQAFAARLLPDPSLNVSYDRLISGPDHLDNLAGQIAQDVNLLRERRVIAAQGRAQVQQVRLDLAWAEWQTAGAARIQAVRVQALAEQVALTRASDASARALLAAGMRAALRGDLSGDPLQADRLAALDADDRLRTAEAALATAQGELARLLGWPPGATIRLAPPPPVYAGALDPARLFALAERRRTDLAALRAGYAAQEAAVHKAVLDQFPALQLAFADTRDSTGNHLLGGAVNFTLPLWNRNRGGIAIEKATRAALREAYVARLAQTRADIATAAEGIAIARRAVADLEGQMPALRRNAAGAHAAAAHGDLAEVTAQTAAQALRDRESQLSAARQALDEQMIALELLTGSPIATWDGQS